MTFAIDAMGECGLSSSACCKCLPKKIKVRLYWAFISLYIRVVLQLYTLAKEGTLSVLKVGVLYVDQGI